MKPLVETWKHKTGRIGRSTIVLLVYNVLFGGVEGLREMWGAHGICGVHAILGHNWPTFFSLSFLNNHTLFLCGEH